MENYNNNKSVDRNDFVGPPDQEEDGVLLQPGRGMDDDMEMDDEMKRYVKLYHRQYLLAKMMQMNGAHSAGSTISLSLTDEHLIPLVNCLEYRRGFVDAIETCGPTCIDCLFLNVDMLNSCYFPLQRLSACLEDLKRALSKCTKLHTVHVTISGTVNLDQIEEIGHVYSSIVSHVPHVKEVSLSVHRTDLQLALDNALRSIWTLPKLERVYLKAMRPMSLRRCLQDLVHAEKLKHLILDGHVDVGVRRHRLIIAAGEALLLSRLFGMGRLESLEIKSVQLVDVPAWQSVFASLASCPLKNLKCSNLVIPEEGRSIFYQFVGRYLPEWKHLESLKLVNRPRTRGGPEIEINEVSQLSIIQGAARLPKIQDLGLPNCFWTQSLVQSLAPLLAQQSPLRKLWIKGTELRDQPTGMAAVTPLLKQCNIEFLYCTLAVEADIVAVANGLELNKSMRELHLISTCPGTLDGVAQVFHALRFHPQLKAFVYEANQYDGQGSPASLRRLLDAVTANVEMESISLSTFARRHNDLQRTIQIITAMNKNGRRYIKHRDAPDFCSKAIRFLAAMNSSDDCLYQHLHEIPMLFIR